MTKIIQFLHPGIEHNEKTGILWNTKKHRRKYLKIQGEYIDAIESNPKLDSIYFWGEWEAQSSIKKINKNKYSFPHFIFEPYLSLPLPKNACNTDPFVFGNCFYYCFCKQTRYTKLRNLESGSIILFGSNKNNFFEIDTVFVIKDSFKYNVDNLNTLKPNYNTIFYNTSLLPLINPENVFIEQQTMNSCYNKKSDCKENSNLEYYIYSAVMHEDRHNFNGIFSYSPCLPGIKGEVGFKKPIINHSLISQKITQGIKIIQTHDIVNVWFEITNQIIAQELKLMIKTALPKIKTH